MANVNELAQLSQVLFATVSPDSTQRRAAEQHLLTASSTPGYPIIVLSLIASPNPQFSGVKQIAAIHFKNLVRKGWADDDADPSSASTRQNNSKSHPKDATQGGNSDTTPYVINDVDRPVIKTNLVSLMTSPVCAHPSIHTQLSASISLIASCDFPSKWTDLLPSLIGKFPSADYGVVNGVLSTVNSILKRFRYCARSDSLYADIQYVLNLLQVPLMTLFTCTSKDVQNSPNDKVRLIPPPPPPPPPPPHFPPPANPPPIPQPNPHSPHRLASLEPSPLCEQFRAFTFL